MGKTHRTEADKVGRNQQLAATLRGRPNGFMESKPRKQRTRRDDKRNAIRNSMEG